MTRTRNPSAGRASLRTPSRSTLAPLTLAALVLSALTGCAMLDDEPTLVERAQLKEEKLTELKQEVDRSVALERARREAEILRAGLRGEISKLEIEAEALRKEIVAIEAKEAAARKAGAPEDDTAAKALETRRMEHQRRVREYEREIEGLKQLLRKSADNG